ncbi:cytochrome P450 [Histoplasma capsulatum G186AR]|uniref:Cytochrome P450 n=2 Tax=Ajellomyces capsulatus TaxID=5037 RepID=C0NKJ0_AJECG|nr:cytochrome P450 [Histoplasma capsulatum G186AR]EEH08381.1 cytochrome P450 [Histoplasma capsulatum G186AR]
MATGILATALHAFPSPLSIPISATVVVVVVVPAVLLLVKLHTDPLRHIPGPLIARLTPLWLWTLTHRGIECRTLAALHSRHGPAVRIAPNEVDLSDGAALYPLYAKNGGCAKNPVYANYDIDGFATIFSAVDAVQRATRARAVAPLFAQRAIVEGRPTMQAVVDAAVAELGARRAVAHGAPIDVLDLFRCLAIDVVSLYLFGESFGGLGSKAPLAATPFVDAFAAGGRFFYVPGWLLRHVDHWAGKFEKGPGSIAASTAVVKEFAARVVDRSIAGEKAGVAQTSTYQGRLLRAGISREETIAQVLDVMFAGTDGIAMTMSVLCWNLARLPDKYTRARHELLNNPSPLNGQSLPYLTAIVKESLRLSMANPTRLPRIVGAEGLHVPGLPTLPAGTSVGLGAYVLHHDPAVFPQPREFMPERWLACTPEMLRNSVPFGVGARMCIARNLAVAVLRWTAEALIRADVLGKNNNIHDGGVGDGVRGVVQDGIEIMEWFNAKVVAGKIEIY